MAGTRFTTLGAIGGGDLRAAAQAIATRAKELAGWSKQIPDRIEVEVAGDVATISCDAPPAYPGETRARHPLFARGDRAAPDAGKKGWGNWYGPPGEPFLGPACDQQAGAAMAKYAQKIDRMCRQAGFQ